MLDTANRVERGAGEVPYLSCECSALRDTLLACIRHWLGTSLQQMRSAAWREIRLIPDGR
jgi:hypothetical protein